eukprot:PhF_6_TR8927/c0_g1_i1/m.14084/K03626/EGD2, NACA; nascent polypeptide-associated complex subunit alpha
MASKKEDPKAVAAAEEAEDDDEEAPELEEIKPDDGEVAGRTGKQSRTNRRYAKAMAKMGMKPEPGVIRVTIRKTKTIMFAISNPEVYKHPGTETYIVFGEASIEDQAQDQAKAAVKQFTQGGADAANDAKAGAAEDEGEVSSEGLEEKDIELVMTQAMVTRGKAIKALRANGGDIVNTIMSLTM